MSTEDQLSSWRAPHDEIIEEKNTIHIHADKNHALQFHWRWKSQKGFLDAQLFHQYANDDKLWPRIEAFDFETKHNFLFD